MSTTAGHPVVPTGDLDTLLAAASAERMAATVARLASDEFTGRRVGTAGVPPPEPGSELDVRL